MADSVNIESALVFREPPIIRPARKVSKRIRHWSHLTDMWSPRTPVESGREIVGRMARVPCALCYPSSYAAWKARPVNCLSTGDVGLTKQLARMYEIDVVDAHLSDNVYSLEDDKAVDMTETCIQVWWFPNLWVVWRKRRPATTCLHLWVYTNFGVN